MKYKKYDNDDSNLLDVNFDTEITINPNFYLHNALTEALKALSSEDIKDGMLKYVNIINYAEIMARSAGILGDDFDNDIKEFKESDDYIKTPENLKLTKLVNKKLGLISKELFDSGKATEKLLL